MPSIGSLDRRSEVLNANDTCARILWLKDLVTKQRTYIQPFVRCALQPRVVEVVAVDVDDGS